MTRYLAVALLLVSAPVFSQTTESVDAPEDQPGQFFLEELDPLIEECVAAARQSFADVRQRFLDGLPPGHELFVTARLTDSSDHVEQLFVLVDRLEERTIHGRIWSDVLYLEDYEAEQPIAVSQESIIDWLIRRPDGTEEGNIVGVYLDRLQETLSAEPCEP